MLGGPRGGDAVPPRATSEEDCSEGAGGRSPPPPAKRTCTQEALEDKPLEHNKDVM